ncbi:MAG: glycosyltransferase [Candidatus Omnitrophica bacterium]|nr:glycosyltransferase [Candidatus Omnitrophota bacterium]
MIRSKVSIIIPAYNAADYIGRALDSVLCQDHHPLEIVIVNDGSTDNLEDVLQRYLWDERIKYIAAENRGVSHAINSGLKSATGEYICFLHADDIFLPGKIKRQLSSMERASRSGVSYTDASYFLEGTSRVVKSPYVHFSGDIFYFIKRNNFIHMSTVMLRRDLFEIAIFDESLACHEDWDFLLKLSAAGIRFQYVNKILSNISVHPKMLSSNTQVMDATRSEVGLRARRLWKAFKSDISPFSAKGISNLKRYAAFKIYALTIGFPNSAKFNIEAPSALLARS